MIACGFTAHLVTIDPRKLDRSFAGRRFDHDLLAALPTSVDPCGENGEFHTFVSSGPMFSAPIAVAVGQIVERDGFIFADVSPA
jgi:diphthamide synthase (EF-2-diphthine--ammonia ligase)